jgi:hypothetical protein
LTVATMNHRYKMPAAEDFGFALFWPIIVVFVVGLALMAFAADAWRESKKQ